MEGGTQTITIDARTKQGARTSQRFAPTAIQSLEVLSLPVVALDAHLRSAVEQNPLLDYDYDQASLTFEEFPSEKTTNISEGEFEDEFIREYDFSFRSSGIQRQSFDLSRLQDDCIETESLKSHLRIQMGKFKHNPRQEVLVNEIIESLDDDGYFTGSLSVIAANHAVDEKKAESLLLKVQTCTPRGIAARSLGECLLLQIDETDPHYEALKAVLNESLVELADNRVPQLLKKHHLSKEDFTIIREQISSLNPRPGASFYRQDTTNYVIPDIAIKQKDQGFSVEVTGELTDTIVLNKDYLELFTEEKTDKETQQWLAGKHEEAQLVLQNISKRKQTLYRFGLFLVEAQYDFFLFGESRLKPLTMQQAADVLELHVSTVSRTVQDKHVLTPWGTYPLKFFFCNALTCKQSENTIGLSSFAIKKCIKGLIEKEDKKAPLSDAALADILNEEGIEIKRRTVAKYRVGLGIEKRAQRRR